MRGDSAGLRSGTPVTMTVLTILAVLILGGAAALVISSLVLDAGADTVADEATGVASDEEGLPDGADKRAGGAAFRAAALQTAQAPAETLRRSRGRRTGRRRSTTTAPDAPDETRGGPEP